MEHAEGYERRWWILGVLCLSLLIIVMDNTILNVALPTLVRKLSASESQLQWMVDAYTLLFAGLLLTMGNLGDKFGRRTTLGAGLAIFAVGSALSSFAGSPSQLIATRALMGVGAALIMPATLSILTNVFPPEERAKAIGIWAGISGVAIALGPVIGGFLLVHYWWGSIFLINVPVCIFALIVGRLIVPNSRDLDAQALDPVGAGLSVIGLVTLVYGIIEAPGKGWTSATIVGSLLVAAVVLTAFVLWELHSDHPMLNVQFFKNPRFTAANMSITLVFFALFGSIFFLTQYLQFVLGYTALQAGLRLTPMALVLMVVAPVAGQLVARVGTKAMVALGMAIGAGGLWYLAQTTPASGYWHVLGGLVIIAVGLSMSMVPATESIMGSLPPGKAGVGSAMNDTTREVGGALGVAILGSVLASHYTATIGKAFASLPGPAIVAAKSSVGGAIQVGQQIGGQVGQALVATAKSTFITAMGSSLEIAAAVALGGAVISALWLPNRPPHVAGHESARDAELEPIGTEIATVEELAAEELMAEQLAAEGAEA
jgi:EmrB/QacA subfamily drug resistance transporter